MELCANIHAALPRELRDMIYDHLVRPGVQYYVMEARDEHGKLRVSNNPLVSVPFFDPRSRIPKEPAVCRDVWKYSEYTGEVVGKEIAERWYRTAIFILYPEDELLDRFLTTDVWEKGVVPADAVRHVRFIIGNHLLKGKNGPSRVFESIRSLPHVSNTKAHITIDLSIGTIFSDEMIFTLHHIGPTAYQLQESGYREVRV